MFSANVAYNNTPLQYTVIESIRIVHKYLKKILARNKYLKQCLESITQDENISDTDHDPYRFSKSIKPLYQHLLNSSITMDKYVTDYVNNKPSINMAGGDSNLFGTHLQHMVGSNGRITHEKITGFLQNCILASKQIELENQTLKSKLDRLHQHKNNLKFDDIKPEGTLHQLQPLIDTHAEASVPVKWKDFDVLKVNVDPEKKKFHKNNNDTQQESDEAPYAKFMRENVNKHKVVSDTLAAAEAAPSTNEASRTFVALAPAPALGTGTFVAL